MLLSACAGIPKDIVDTGDRYTSAAVAGIEDYRLGAGDKVKVTVYNEQTLSGEYSVNADGALSLPLIGEIPAVGKKVSDIAVQYQGMLSQGYLRDPKVSMEIVTYRPFFILGEVKLPGQYPYASGMTALNAIAVAQGFTPRAEKGVVYIRSAGTEAAVPYRLSPDLRVWPGDTIRVGEKYF
jgi:polysaccharide export outer membrane protein